MTTYIIKSPRTAWIEDVARGRMRVKFIVKSTFECEPSRKRMKGRPKGKMEG